MVNPQMTALLLVTAASVALALPNFPSQWSSESVSGSATHPKSPLTYMFRYIHLPGRSEEKERPCVLRSIVTFLQGEQIVLPPRGADRVPLAECFVFEGADSDSCWDALRRWP